MVLSYHIILITKKFHPKKAAYFQIHLKISSLADLDIFSLKLSHTLHMHRVRELVHRPHLLKLIPAIH